MNKLKNYRILFYSFLSLLVFFISFLFFVDPSFFLKDVMFDDSKVEFYLQGVDVSVSNMGVTLISCKARKAFLMDDAFHFKLANGLIYSNESQIIPFKAYQLSLPFNHQLVSMTEAKLDFMLTDSLCSISANFLNWDLDESVIHVEKNVRLVYETFVFNSDESFINLKEQTFNFYDNSTIRAIF